MTNTKIAALMLLLLMAISIIPLAAADDGTNTMETEWNETITTGNGTEEINTNETVTTGNGSGQTDPNEAITPETEDELAAVISPNGAEVRLLQLEKALTANILKGEEVIEYILEKNPTADVTEANRILDEMSLLLDEVKAAKTTGTGADLARTFVDLKNDAIKLTQDFREEVRNLIIPGGRDELARRLNTLKNPQLDKLDDAIKGAKNQYNAEQVKALFTSLGITDEELIQAVEDGTATKEDIKDALNAALEEMTKEQKKESQLKLKESLSKKTVAHKAAVASTLSNILERQSQRWEDRSQKFLTKSQEAKANNQSIKETVMLKLSDRVQIRSQVFLDRSEDLKEQIEEGMKERKGNGHNDTENQNGTEDNDDNETESEDSEPEDSEED